MVWIDCPTGGWWRHIDHPADDHDGEAPVPEHSDGSEEPESYWERATKTELIDGGDGA